MFERPRGRPRLDLKLLNLNDSLEFIKQHYVGKRPFKKKTLYNMMCDGRLTKYGHAHERLLDVEELKRLCGVA